MSACSDVPLAPAAARSVDQELIERIGAMGFRADQVVDEGDHFRVEGDVIILKRDLTGIRLSRAAAPGGPLHQWYTDNLVSQANMAGGLRVSLSGISSSSDWTAAARSALSAYSGGSGSKIVLVEGSPADITFSFAALGTGVIATGSFPASGLPGSTVTISSAYTTPLSAAQKTWVMVHELGHTLGFRHSNWQANGETTTPFGASQVPGTPSSDLASVMRITPATNPTWSGFNSYDAAANAYAYPAPAPALTADARDLGGSAHLVWSAVSDVSGYQVYQHVSTYEVADATPPAVGVGTASIAVYDLGTVTTASYTSTDTYVGNTCTRDYHVEYEIVPVYPSGKTGPSTTSRQYC
ncbi:MAG TPA: M57 family metalloprotease [Longimicrobium sp.]|nr:M57 family metalloprotease [Longimicrobium sp.]